MASETFWVGPVKDANGAWRVGIELRARILQLTEDEAIEIMEALRLAIIDMEANVRKDARA